MERIGRDSIYRDRNAVQTKPATSVDRFLRHDVMETYEELCENRLLPTSVLPR
jgi:hypothetical protein